MGGLQCKGCEISKGRIGVFIIILIKVVWVIKVEMLINHSNILMDVGEQQKMN